MGASEFMEHNHNLLPGSSAGKGGSVFALTFSFFCAMDLSKEVRTGSTHPVELSAPAVKLDMAERKTGCKKSMHFPFICLLCFRSHQEILERG